ncbi:RDD family protein [Virgibacillus kimchii]
MKQEQIDIKTPEFVSLEFSLAGLGSRSAAMIIDQVILTLANIALFLVLFLLPRSDMFLLMESGWLVAIFFILIFVINWGYFFTGEYFYNGKTIGKRMVGIRVIQENGHNITFMSALIRNLLRIIDMLPTSYFLGIILVFFHSKHKRLGDMAAGTVVVLDENMKRKKKSALEKEIEQRGLNKNSFHIDELAYNALGSKEYNLLRTYSSKLMELRDAQRSQLTIEMAEILLPKVGLDTKRKSVYQLENELMVLYLKMREDWEFEL